MGLAKCLCRVGLHSWAYCFINGSRHVRLCIRCDIAERRDVSAAEYPYPKRNGKAPLTAHASS